MQSKSKWPNDDGVFRDEMKLKIILLMCNAMVTSNALILYVIGFKEIFQPSMTSTNVCVFSLWKIASIETTLPCN
jgi:hypothetical protein